jgi:hypothetical protein
MAKTKSDCVRVKMWPRRGSCDNDNYLLGSRPKYQNRTLEPHGVGILNTDAKPTKHPLGITDTGTGKTLSLA